MKVYGCFSYTIGKEEDFLAWTEEFWTKALDRFSDPSAGKKKACSCSKQTCCSKGKVEVSMIKCSH